MVVLCVDAGTLSGFPIPTSATCPSLSFQLSPASQKPLAASHSVSPPRHSLLNTMPVFRCRTTPRYTRLKCSHRTAFWSQPTMRTRKCCWIFSPKWRLAARPTLRRCAVYALAAEKRTMLACAQKENWPQRPDPVARSLLLRAFALGTIPRPIVPKVCEGLSIHTSNTLCLVGRLASCMHSSSRVGAGRNRLQARSR